METVSDIDKCVSLRNLVPFEQFQKREKHPWRSVTFSNFKGFSLELYEKYHSSICIFPVFKLYKWHQIAHASQIISVCKFGLSKGHGISSQLVG